MHEERDTESVTRGSGDPHPRDDHGPHGVPKLDDRPVEPSTGWSPTAWKSPKEDR